MGAKDDHFEVADEAVKSRRSSKKKKQPKKGCCWRFFNRVFHKMYPAKKKDVHTSQGAWLRTMAGVAMFFDFCFFVFALAIVGFRAMIIDLLLGVWGYSVYLTLREWTVILYIIFKALAAFGLMFDNDSGSSYSGQMASTQIFGLFLNAGFHILSIYYVGRAYFYFRKNGGIHGLKKTQGLPEEKMLEKAGELADKGAKKVFDKQDAQDRADDLEAAQVKAAINN